MLPEVRRSSEVYGQTNIGGKAARVFQSPGSPVTSRPRCLAVVRERRDGEEHLWHWLLYAMNTGEKAVKSENGLLTTIAWARLAK